MQGQRDVVGSSSQIGEREEQIALRLKHDPTLFEELLEGVTAQNALRHRSRHQITASGLIADRDREAVGILKTVLSGRSDTTRTKDPHQFKPGIGLHDESRGTSSTDRRTQGGRDDVDEGE